MTAPNGLVLARKKASVSREVAWTYLIETELRLRWWPASNIDPRVGGAISERPREDDESASHVRDAAGVIDVLIEGNALGFRWTDNADGHETEVLVTLRSSDVGTDITVTETGFGRFTDAYARIADAQQGWIELLTDYVEVLATAELSEAVAASEPESTESVSAESESAGPAEEEVEPEEEDESEEVETQIDFDTLIRNSIEGR